MRLRKRFANIEISWRHLAISASRATQNHCAFAMCLLFVGLCMGFDVVAACDLMVGRCRAHAVLHFRADAERCHSECEIIARHLKIQILARSRCYSRAFVSACASKSENVHVSLSCGVRLRMGLCSRLLLRCDGFAPVVLCCVAASYVRRMVVACAYSQKSAHRRAIKILRSDIFLAILAC